jgi:hypothetical protein
LVGFVIDRAPGKPTARAMLLCGAAAAVAPLTSLWRSGHTIDGALHLVSDLALVMTAWGAQAVGWLIGELAPILIRGALEAGVTAQTARLKLERARLQEAWSLGPTTEANVRAAPAGAGAKRHTD